MRRSWLVSGQWNDLPIPPIQRMGRLRWWASGLAREPWGGRLLGKVYCFLRLIIWEYDMIWLYELQISTTTLGMIDDDCTVDDWWLGRFNEATRQKEYDHPKDDPWGFRMCLAMLAARIFLRMKLVSRLQRTLDFILIFSPTRGLKNGGPRLKTKPWFILGVRLQEGMARSQGWHLVVKIFQLALPNSHEHPNAIGISNDNGPPRIWYASIFYTSLKTPQEFPVECWRCGFQTSSCALPLSQCLGLNRAMPGGSNGWCFVIPKQQKTSEKPTAPTSNLILYRWNIGEIHCLILWGEVFVPLPIEIGNRLVIFPTGCPTSRTEVGQYTR